MIRDPIVILGPPRSGTSVLYRTLQRVTTLWSLDDESHRILEGPFHPEIRGWESNALRAEDLDGETADRLRAAFEEGSLPGWVRRYQEICREEGVPSPFRPARIAFQVRWACRGWQRPPAVRFLEKTPKNCLRVGFLARLFPDARFIHLRRDGRATISSLMDGWRTPDAFNTYIPPEPLRIGGYEGKHWCFVLPPGWRDLVNRPLEEVCAMQWRACVDALRNDLPPLAAGGRVFEIAYEDLVRDPRAAMAPLLRWLDLPFQNGILAKGKGLRVVNATSAPEPGKWRLRNGPAIDRILPIIADAQRDLGYEC